MPLSQRELTTKVHELETKNNAMRKRLDKQEAIIDAWKRIARRLKKGIRFMGWLSITFATIVFFLDFLVRFFNITYYFKFIPSEGYGWIQATVITVSGIAGFALIIIGYWRTR